MWELHGDCQHVAGGLGLQESKTKPKIFAVFAGDGGSEQVKWQEISPYVSVSQVSDTNSLDRIQFKLILGHSVLQRRRKLLAEYGKC